LICSRWNQSHLLIFEILFCTTWGGIYTRHKFHVVWPKMFCLTTEFVLYNTKRSLSICVVRPNFVSSDQILCRTTTNLCSV
jgi:hypothetical protein